MAAAEVISALTQLDSLELCGFTEHTSEEEGNIFPLARLLSRHSRLQVLVLQEIERDAATGFQPPPSPSAGALLSLTNLRILRISKCKTTPDAVSARALERLPLLRVFAGDGVDGNAPIGPILSAPHLRVLSLAVTLSGPPPYEGHLAQRVTQLPALAKLDLSHSDFEATGVAGIGALPQLRWLSLANTGIEELPEDMAALVNLSYLDLSGNALSALPNCLYSLTRVQVCE